MAEDSGLEKTEPASQRRLDQARRDGDIPRSRELTTCLLLLAAGGGFWMAGELTMRNLMALLSAGLAFDPSVATDEAVLLQRFRSLLFDAMIYMTPIVGTLVVVALAAPLAVGGWMFSAKAFTPQFSRLDMLKGLGRMVSAHSAVELVKAIAKVCVVGFVAYWVVAGQIPGLLRLVDLPSQIGSAHLADMMLASYFSIVGALVLIAAIDAPYQIWHYANKLKMSKQELRDEAKETEGNPEIKSKIRQLQRAIARRRMMAAVPTADVVVTNPTHYSVALKYAENSMGAPRVVAKGVDAVAMRIREIATENGVVLLEAPPLARALYKHSDIGDEIPPTLYSAVAEVLAYVFQLRNFRTTGGVMPTKPTAVAVPADMDPLQDAAGGGNA